MTERAEARARRVDQNTIEGRVSIRQAGAVRERDDERTRVELCTIRRDQRHPARADVARDDERSRRSHGRRLTPRSGANVGDTFAGGRPYCGTDDLR